MEVLDAQFCIVKFNWRVPRTEFQLIVKEPEVVDLAERTQVLSDVQNLVVFLVVHCLVRRAAFVRQLALSELAGPLEASLDCRVRRR